MYHKTEMITNEFGRAIVACEVVESFNTSSGVKSSIKVKNTGNIDAYLRVSLVSWWEDVNGNAEAIQSAPSDAVTSAWKVSVASDGMINPMN